MSDNFIKNRAEKADSNNTEEGEKHGANELHAESHATVFGEEKVKPITCYAIVFVKHEVRFDLDFNQLVNDNHSQYNEYCYYIAFVYAHGQRRNVI